MPAGTVVVFHHGLWHCGRRNPSREDRWMHKIRLNPRVSQTRHWNTDDLDAFQNDASDHVFATMRTSPSSLLVKRRMQKASATGRDPNSC